MFSDSVYQPTSLQPRFMDRGLWVWPADEKGQKDLLNSVGASPHLVAAMASIMKSGEGLSNAELVDSTADSSNWLTLWTVRQLTSLGFIEYSVDLFGGPARYRLTDLGRSAYAAITGKPVLAPQGAPARPPETPPAAQPQKPAPAPAPKQ
jgi:hypothetical protein